MNEEIENKLTEMAYEETTPFCYACYRECPDRICPGCGSDDLMRHLEGIGVEWGVEWVFPYLLDKIEAVDTDSIFEAMIEGSYGETVVIGFITAGVVKTIKESDPIAWRLAKIDYIDGLVEERSLTIVGKKYYWTDDLKNRL